MPSLARRWRILILRCSRVIPYLSLPSSPPADCLTVIVCPLHLTSSHVISFFIPCHLLFHPTWFSYFISLYFISYLAPSFPLYLAQGRLTCLFAEFPTGSPWPILPMGPHASNELEFIIKKKSRPAARPSVLAHAQYGSQTIIGHMHSKLGGVVYIRTI